MVSLVHRGPFPSMKNDNICHRHLSEQGVGRKGLYTYLASGIATQSGHPSHPSPPLAAMRFHLVLDAVECDPGVVLDPMTTSNESVVVHHHLVATLLSAMWHMGCLCGGGDRPFRSSDDDGGCSSTSVGGGHSWPLW